MLDSMRRYADIASCKVTTLQHELRYDAVELETLVAKPFFSSAESTKVLRSLRDYVVVEGEVDPAFLSCM